MKFRIMMIVLTCVLLVSCGTVTPTATPTATPAATSTGPKGNSLPAVLLADGTRYYELDDGYSYIPPEGWSGVMVRLKDKDRRVFYQHSQENSLNSIFFMKVSDSRSMEEFIKINMQAFSESYNDFELISQQDFSNDAGLACTRVMINYSPGNTYVTQLMYFIKGGDNFYIGTFTRLQNEDQALDAVADQAMASFSID